MKRILLVTPEAPWPPTSGGRQRTNLLYQALAATAQVDLLCLRDETELKVEDVEVLRRKFNLLAFLRPSKAGERWPWKLLRPIKPGLVDRIAHNLGRKAAEFRADPKIVRWVTENIDCSDYDLIVGRYLHSVSRTGLLNAPATVCDIDDHPSMIYESRLAMPETGRAERWILQRHLNALESTLPALLKTYKGLWISNPGDLSRVGVHAVEVLANVPWNGTRDPSNEAGNNSKVMLCVASMNHAANVRGISIFIDEVWPLIKKEEPEAEFVVVGSGSAADKKTIERWNSLPGITVRGFVESLEQEYQRAAFTVAPIFYGGGTNIKVLESLAYGRTAVVTQKAINGFENALLEPACVLLAKNHEAFATQCILLLRSKTQRDTLAATGMGVVEQQFSRDGFQQQVNGALLKWGVVSS